MVRSLLIFAALCFNIGCSSYVAGEFGRAGLPFPILTLLPFWLVSAALGGALALSLRAALSSEQGGGNE